MFSYIMTIWNFNGNTSSHTITQYTSWRRSWFAEAGLCCVCSLLPAGSVQLLTEKIVSVFLYIYCTVQAVNIGNRERARGIVENRGSDIIWVLEKRRPNGHFFLGPAGSWFGFAKLLSFSIWSMAALGAAPSPPSKSSLQSSRSL